MKKQAAQELLPGLYRIADTCNVYLVRGADSCIAIDFGSGRWLDQVKRLRLPPLRHVFMTHHHLEQCGGLQARKSWPFEIHAPAGEEKFLSPQSVRRFWKTRRENAMQGSYSVLPRGIAGVRYDVAGFCDFFWGDRRIRFIHTPGHGANALSIVLDHEGQQVVFCGDAAHAGATVWQPYHLEWDHWTGSGALAAWEGIERLANIGMDLLCPSHGPVIAARDLIARWPSLAAASGAAARDGRHPRSMLRKLSAKLLNLYRVKGSICPGQKDRYLPARRLGSGAFEVLPNLYQFGANAYLLTSKTGQGLVIDYCGQYDAPWFESLLKELGRPKLTAALVTHFHYDHSQGIPELKARYGTESWLHPYVAQPLRKIGALDVPYLPAKAIRPDHLWPVEGTWRWNECEFKVAPLPAQTWWHCGFMTTIDGRKVFFGGDNFQPNSRWNGTGGFCALNGSRFREGFAASAQRIIDWRPDIIADGHGTYFRYQKSQFTKIVRWAGQAESAVQALCPSGGLERDYFLHPNLQGL